MRALCLIALFTGLVARAAEREADLPIPPVELPKSGVAFGILARGMITPQLGGGGDLYVAFKMNDVIFTKLETGALWTPGLVGWGGVTAELHYQYLVAGVGLGGAREVTGSPLDAQWYYGALRLGVKVPAFARASALVCADYRMEFRGSGLVNGIFVAVGGEWAI